MGQLYILKLEKNKWYVGFTERGIVRVLEQLQNEGRYKAAKWTQKYRPVNWENAVEWVSPKGKTLQDEDEKTLELMREHGVRNVRGGQWCKVRMTRKEINDLGRRAAKTKAKKIRTVTCGRCGRTGHNKLQCYAKTTIEGKRIGPERKVRKKASRNKLRQEKSSKSVKSRSSADEITESSSKLKSRGVFCEDPSMSFNVRGMWKIFKRYSNQPELSDEKWYKVMNHWFVLTSKPLISLYPPDHWFHDPEHYDDRLSKEFELDGYLWTSGGAAVNPKIRDLQIQDMERIKSEQILAAEERKIEKQKAREERELEKQKARELALLQKEERRKRIEEEKEQELIRLEKENLQKEEFRKDCIKKLRDRGVLIEHSMATSMASFNRGLKRDGVHDIISSKWLDYFSTVTRGIDLIPLYPPDHWMHDNEKFNEILSKEFEYDGFGWTESGFASKIGTKSNDSKEYEVADPLNLENIEMIFDSVTKEIEKTGKTVRREARKLRDEFRKRTGL